MVRTYGKEDKTPGENEGKEENPGQEAAEAKGRDGLEDKPWTSAGNIQAPSQLLALRSGWSRWKKDMENWIKWMRQREVPWMGYPCFERVAGTGS